MRLRFVLPAVFLLGVAIALPALAQDAYGPVRRGEDLWDIAKHIYHDQEVSRDQIMLALLKANPHAFDMPCNANSPLKTGVNLHIPSLAQVKAMNREQASQEFEQQLREWESHRLSGKVLVCPPAIPIAAVALVPSATFSQVAAPTTRVPAAPPVPAPETTPAPVRSTATAASAPASEISSESRATAAGLTLKQRLFHDMEWIGIPILVLLLLGIILWKYRRPPSIAVPSPVTIPAEGAVDYA